MKFGILASALLLGGCASVYDPSAWPAASQTNQIGYAQCNAAVSRHEIKTHVALANCYLAADEVMATAVRLQKMDLYNSYAAQTRSVAIDADAGRISDLDFFSRFKSAQTDYVSAIGRAYAQTEAQNVAESNFLAGAVSAFATGYAQGRSATPPPVFTTCTKNGVIVNCISQ